MTVVVVTDLVVFNRAVGVCNRRAVINPNVDRRQENYAQLLADAGEPKFLTQPSAARIDFNNGQRDIGRQVLSLNAHPKAKRCAATATPQVPKT